MINIRRPSVDDVNEIFRLTNKMAKNGLMLSRSKYKIISMLNNFMIAEDSETQRIVGCGAFSLLWTDMGEIMALAVDDDFQKKGVGKLLVNALLEEGRRLNVPEVIALTYQVDFFKKLGFTLADKDKFPRKMWRECLECPKLEQCDETALHIFLKTKTT